MISCQQVAVSATLGNQMPFVPTRPSLQNLTHHPSPWILAVRLQACPFSKAVQMTLHNLRANFYSFSAIFAFGFCLVSIKGKGNKSLANTSSHRLKGCSGFALSLSNSLSLPRSPPLYLKTQEYLIRKEHLLL